MKYNKIRICCKISLLTSKKAVHINKPLSPQKTSENLWFSNYFFLGGNRLSNWFKFVWYKKQNLAKSILSSQSQYDQSIWLTKSIWPVTFKATCVSIWYSRSFLLVEGIWCWEMSPEESVLVAEKVTCEVTLLPCW